MGSDDGPGGRLRAVLGRPRTIGLLAGLACFVLLIGDSMIQLAVHTTNCVMKSYHVVSGGFTKSGMVFKSPTDVFDHFPSRVGLPGFLNAAMPSDKGATHNYSSYYDVLLAPYVQQQTVTLLEVGVKMGGSLMLWRELFGHHSSIYGVDIDSSAPMFEKDAHIKVVSGLDSTDAEAVERSLKGLVFDIIIDDGNHRASAQTHTLIALWRHLSPQGIYIIEDVVNDCFLLRNMWAAITPGMRRIHNFHTLAEVAEIDVPESHRLLGQDVAVSVHFDTSKERLVVVYPGRSTALAGGRELLAPRRCAMGAPSFGPPCEAVMRPCDNATLRSP